MIQVVLWKQHLDCSIRKDIGSIIMSLMLRVLEFLKSVNDYFVCLRKDLELSEFQFPEPTDECIALEELLLPSDDPRLDDLIIELGSALELRIASGQGKSSTANRYGREGGQGERVYSPKGHAITLSAYGGGIGAKTGMYFVDGRVRRLHPVECRRLMGFPEDFVLHPRRNVCYRQFGNSVVVPLVRKIFQSIERTLDIPSLRAA